MVQIPSVADDPAVKAATARQNEIREKRIEVEAQLRAQQTPFDLEKSLKEKIVAGQTISARDLEPSSPAQEKMASYATALRRAEAEQKSVVQRATQAAKKRLLEDLGLSNEHTSLLHNAGIAAKAFGESCCALESFYAAMEAAGLGGSSLGHYGFGDLNPGLLSDANSNISTWYKQVREDGHWFSL